MGRLGFASLLSGVLLAPSAAASIATSDTAPSTSVVIRKATTSDGKTSEQVYKKVVKNGQVVEESGDKALAERLLMDMGSDVDAFLAELKSDRPDFERLLKSARESTRVESHASASQKSSANSNEHHSSSDRKSPGRTSAKTPGTTSGPRTSAGRTTRPPMSPASGRFAPRQKPSAPAAGVRRS